MSGNSDSNYLNGNTANTELTDHESYDDRRASYEHLKQRHSDTLGYTELKHTCLKYDQGVVATNQNDISITLISEVTDWSGSKNDAKGVENNFESFRNTHANKDNADNNVYMELQETVRGETGASSSNFARRSHRFDDYLTPIDSSKKPVSKQGQQNETNTLDNHVYAEIAPTQTETTTNTDSTKRRCKKRLLCFIIVVILVLVAATTVTLVLTVFNQDRECSDDRRAGYEHLKKGHVDTQGYTELKHSCVKTVFSDTVAKRSSHFAGQFSRFDGYCMPVHLSKQPVTQQRHQNETNSLDSHIYAEIASTRTEIPTNTEHTKRSCKKRFLFFIVFGILVLVAATSVTLVLTVFKQDNSSGDCIEGEKLTKASPKSPSLSVDKFFSHNKSNRFSCEGYVGSGPWPGMVLQIKLNNSNYASIMDEPVSIKWLGERHCNIQKKEWSIILNNTYQGASVRCYTSLAGQEWLSENITITLAIYNEIAYASDCAGGPDEVCLTSGSVCTDVCTCTVNKYYHQVDDSCNLINCGPVPSIDRGQVVSQTSLYGNKLSITCEYGYELSDANDVVCLIHNTWGLLPSCIIVKCNEKPSLNNGNISSDMEAPHVFMDIIKFICDDGYERNGHVESFCQADKVWSPVPTCDPVICDEFVTPDYSETVPVVTSGLEFNDQITVTCLEGYEISGNNKIICQSDKSWSESPSCNPKKCSVFTPPTNAIIDYAKPIAISYQDIISIQCELGYERNGPSNVYCKADQTWTESPSCNPVNCSTYELPPNGLIDTSKQVGKSFGETIHITCKEGYEIEGSYIVTCKENKSWSPSPFCNPVNCSQYEHHMNGYIDSSKPQGSSYNETIYVTCNPGFALGGSIFVICQSNQTWSESPICNRKNCSEYIPPSNSTIGRSTGLSYEDEIIIVCDTGYKMFGPNRVTCTENESWSIGPSCNPSNCSSFTAPVNGKIDASKSQKMSYQDTIHLTCKIGYEMEGPSIVTCQTNNTWSKSPSCNPVNCSKYSPPGYGTIDDAEIIGSSYSETIYIICDVGYVIEGSDFVTCQANKDWTASPSCNPVNCSAYEVPPNGSINTSYPIGKSFKETIYITCNEGYDIEGSAMVVCEEDKTWSNSPSCHPVNCSDYIPPGNGSKGATKPIGLSYLETINILCDEGYVIEGQQFVTCQSNKTWTENPYCNPVNCSAFQLPEHGYIDNSFPVGTSYNETIHVLCEDGYEIDGSAVVSCQADESWTEDGICQPITCDPLDAPANSMTIPSTTNGLTYGATVNVTCISGFTLTGSVSIICNTDGSWTESPTCDPVECPIDTLPDKRDTMSETADKYVYLDEISIQCQDGFNLNGEPDIVCTADGTWSSTPTCDRVNCSAYPTDMNMYIEEVEQDIYYFEDNITVACNDGYELDGEKIITCEPDSTWSDDPHCVPSNCTTYIIPENGNIVPTVKSTNVYGDTISIECNEGYKLKGNDTVFCLSNKSWSETPTCEPLSCLKFTLPSNSLVESGAKTEHSFGDIVKLNCSSGFELEGNRSIICQSDQTWSEIPTCGSLKCPPISNPINGKITPEESEFYISGDSIMFECDEGYILVGDETIVCLENQTWGEVPTCDPVDCESYTIPENSVIVNENGTFLGAVIDVECKSGYNLTGQSSIVCQTSGNWSDFPTCTAVDCGPFTFPSRSKTYDEYESVFMSEINDTCNDGFGLVNENENQVVCDANGLWKGSPECTLQGTVSLSTNDQSDTYLENAIIDFTCEVSNAVNWKTIVFATIISQTFTPDVVLKALITVQKIGDTDAASEKVALLETSVIGETDISLHIQLVGTNCTDSGEYFCIVSPEGIQSSISEYENVAYTSVDIIVETTPKTSSLKVSSFLYRDESNTFTCEGDVGSDPDTELSLQIQLNNSNYDFIADEPASSIWIRERHCNIQRKEWNILLDDTYQGASVRCHTSLAGLEWFSEDITITLATYNDIFFKEAPTAVIGERFTLSCIANNFFNLTEIIIAKHGSSIVTFRNINDYTITATDNPENLDIVSNSFLNDTFAEVNVMIKTVRCQDKGLYTCMAYTSDELIRDTEAALTTQRYPKMPKLDLSLEMVENQTQMIDFPTTCVAQVGYPDGELVLETDKDGAFAAVDLTSSPFSNITYDTNEEECSKIATITYYNIYQLDWQRTNMKCSVQNTATFKEGEELYVIKNVEIIAASTCDSAPVDSIRDHTFCYGQITCEENRISATQLCPSTDQCYDSTISLCVPCEDVGKCYDQLEYSPRRLVCDNIDTVPGSVVTAACQLYYITIDIETDSIVVTKDTDIILDTSGEDAVNNDGRFDTTLELAVQVESDKVSLLFTPLQWCNQTGMYTITLERNAMVFQDKANVTIINSATIPIITKVPTVYYRDQEITVTCKSSLGQPLGNTKMTLKYKQAADANFIDLTNTEITITYDADHCTHVGIQTYSFIATNDTDGDQIKCETTTHGGEIIVSEVETITIVEPAIVFEDPVLESFIDDDAIIVCKVKDIEDISEVNFGTEDGTVYLTLTKTDFNNNLVFGRFQIMNGDSFIDQSSAVLQLKISSVACGDKGKYFCEAKYGLETLPRTVMELIAFRKSTVPTLDLSIDIIENKYPWPTLQTTCIAEVGYPTPGSLVLESDYTSSYSPVDLTAFGSKLEYSRDDDTCSTMATIWFINTYTMAWDTSTMKCAARNTTTYGTGSDNELSVTKVVRVIRENYCNGSTGPRVAHPFACYAELSCTPGFISAVDNCGGNRLQCYISTTFMCVPCESIDKCDVEGIENVPTITTTPIPGQPNIACNEVTSSVGVTVVTTCTLLYLNLTDDIPVRIKQGGTLILNSTNTQGTVTIANGLMFDVQANLNFIVYEVNIDVNFEPLKCEHATSYTVYIDVNDAETISASFEVFIKTSAAIPVLTTSPDKFYQNQQLKITCVGNLGKPVDSTHLVLKTRASETAGLFTLVTPIASSSDEDIELCATVKTIEHVLILSTNTDNTQYICETTTDDGEVLQSEIMTIELTEPVIFFGNDQPTVEIGSTATIKCTISNPPYPDEASGIVITRRNSASFEIEELARVENGVKSTNEALTGITGSEMYLSGKLLLTVTFDEIVCEDAGEYFCEAITTPDSSFKTRRFISLKRTATIDPELTLPIQMIVDEATRYSSDHLTCTADVGYPAGDVRIQYLSTDSQTYVDFDIGTKLPLVESEGDCIVNKTVAYRSITFSESHNNTRMKCVVYNGNTTITESQEQTILLLSNTCADDDDVSYHPYDCHLYNACQSGGLSVRSCNAGCPDINTETNVLISCARNCTALCG